MGPGDHDSGSKWGLLPFTRRQAIAATHEQLHQIHKPRAQHGTRFSRGGRGFAAAAISHHGSRPADIASPATLGGIASGAVLAPALYHLVKPGPRPLSFAASPLLRNASAMGLPAFGAIACGLAAAGGISGAMLSTRTPDPPSGTIADGFSGFDNLDVAFISLPGLGAGLVLGGIFGYRLHHRLSATQRLATLAATAASCGLLASVSSIILREA